MPAVDSCVEQAVSELLSGATRMDLPDRNIGESPTVPDSTVGADAESSRNQLLNLALRLIDGSIDEAAFQRRRRKLTRAPNQCESCGAPLTKTASARVGIASTNRVTSAWAEAQAEHDMDRQRMVLQQLINDLIPQRRGQARYAVRIR